MATPYRLTPELRKKPGVQDIFGYYEGMAKSGFDSMDTFDDDQLLEIMHRFTASREFVHSFSSEERSRSIGAFAAAASGEGWRIGVQQDESGLFSIEVPEKVLPSGLYDGLVVSGALGWHFDDEKDLLEFGETHTMSAREAYQIAGAAGSVVDKSYLGGSYTRDAGSLRTEQYLGADVHGDFRTVRTVSAIQEIIAPGGEQVGFAPIISKESVSGYHSTELTITKALLEQLRQTMPTDALNEALYALLQRLAVSDKGNRHLFADFGDDVVERMQPHDLPPLKKGDAIGGFINTPGTIRGATTIRYGHEGAMFYQDIVQAGDTPGRVMTIPNDEITDFIVALSDAGQGRTAVYHIHQLVAGFIV